MIALNSLMEPDLLYLPSPPPEKRRPGRPRKDRSLEPFPPGRKKRTWKVSDDRPKDDVMTTPEPSPDYQPEPTVEIRAEVTLDFQAEAALQTPPETLIRYDLEFPSDSTSDYPQKTPPELAPCETPLPLLRKIVMTRPYGFIADNGLQYHWFQGETIDDPQVIALLLQRQCSDFTALDGD